MVDLFAQTSRNCNTCCKVKYLFLRCKLVSTSLASLMNLENGMFSSLALEKEFINHSFPGNLALASGGELTNQNNSNNYANHCPDMFHNAFMILSLLSSSSRNRIPHSKQCRTCHFINASTYPLKIMPDGLMSFIQSFSDVPSQA